MYAYTKRLVWKKVGRKKKSHNKYSAGTVNGMSLFEHSNKSLKHDMKLFSFQWMITCPINLMNVDFCVLSLIFTSFLLVSLDN